MIKQLAQLLIVVAGIQTIQKLSKTPSVSLIGM